MQAVTRNRLAKERQEPKWAEPALKLVNKAFPFRSDAVETSPGALWPSVERSITPDHPNVATFANNVGHILQSRGDLVGALKQTQDALAIDEVPTDANNIGLILQDQGDLAGALQYAKRALRIFQATYGPGNPQTKIVSRNLADLEQALAKQAGS